LDKKIFYVKRRSAYMHGGRPHCYSSLLPADKWQGKQSLELMASFTDDQQNIAFAKHFCDFCEPQTRKYISGQSMAQFCSRILHECFLRDSQQALPLYLALRSSIDMVNSGYSARVAYAWDFRLIRSYYQRSSFGTGERNSNGLLNCELVTYLMELLEYALSNGNFGNTLLSVFHDSPSSTTRILKTDADDMDLS